MSIFKFNKETKKFFNAALILGGSTFGSAGLALLTQVLLARLMNVGSYGEFSSALSVINIVSPIVGLGIGSFWLYVIGKEGWLGLRWIRPSLNLLLINIPCVAIVLGLFILLMPNSGPAKLLLIILFFHALGKAVSELTSAKYQLEGRDRALALWQLSPNLLRASSIAFVFVLGNSQQSSFLVAGVAYTIPSLLIIAYGVKELLKLINKEVELEGHRNNNLGNLEIEHKSSVFEIVAMSLPFCLAAFFHLIYFQSDIVLVRYFVSEVEAGFYNIAFTIICAIYLFPVVIYQKLLIPRIHRWAYSGRQKLNYLYFKGSWLMMSAGLLASILLFLFSENIVLFIFGNDYEPSIILVKILSFGIPLRFVSTSIGALLMTQGNIISKVKLMSLVAAVNVFLNIILIPEFGGKGAAVATVFSEAILLILYYFSSKKLLNADNFQWEGDR